MAHRLFASLVLLFGAGMLSSQARAEDEATRQAIQRGVACLKEMQGGDGSWPTHHAGATALVGLTQEMPRDGVVLTVAHAPDARVMAARFAAPAAAAVSSP